MNLKILIVEDCEADAELAARELRRAGIECEMRCVETATTYRQALVEFQPELILSDFSMPHFDGLAALAISRELRPEVPFIFLSGTIGEEHAIEALRNGATDYILKNRSARLAPAVQRAIQEARFRLQHKDAGAAKNSGSERLAGIVASLHDVIWSIDISSRTLVYTSDALRTVYHGSAAAFYKGAMPWDELIHPDDRQRVVSEWTKVSQSDAYDCEHRILVADGDVRWVHNRGWRSSRENPPHQLIDGIAQDTTLRRGQQRRIARLGRILIKEIRNAAADKRKISPYLVDILARTLENPTERLSHEQLSDRELQIMLLIGSGRSVKQIAGDLSISINTVNTHRARILKKMDMRSNAELIRYTVEHALVD